LIRICFFDGFTGRNNTLCLLLRVQSVNCSRVCASRAIGKFHLPISRKPSTATFGCIRKRWVHGSPSRESILFCCGSMSACNSPLRDAPGSWEKEHLPRRSPKAVQFLLMNSRLRGGSSLSSSVNVLPLHLQALTIFLRIYDSTTLIKIFPRHMQRLMNVADIMRKQDKRHGLANLSLILFRHSSL